MTMTALKESCVTAQLPNLCIVAPYEPTLSETFIRGHIERLPARVSLVCGWPLQSDGAPVLSSLSRAYHKLRRTLTGGDIEAELTASYVTAFRAVGADVILAEYGDVGAGVAEACRRMGLPLVVHFHGYDASVREVLETHRESYQIMFRQAAAIVAVSRAMQRRLLALGAPPAKVYYNPYGIDCQRFDRADPSLAPPVFLAVGRFVEKKAPQLTISAFAEVHKHLPDAGLRMIGDGPLLEECRTLVSKLQIGEKVEFLGAQPHDVVQREMKTARAFVQHSIEASNGDCEGTPLGVLEAGASGLPVVSTRHAGIPDVVIEEETGFLVDELDVQGMAMRMLTLARDPDLAGTLGRAARARIVENFSQERADRNLWRIIDSCISARDASASRPT